MTTPTSHNALQDFFFRTADRMRVEGCANAIANEGLSLVLYSPHEPLLDHYLSLLLERLRRQTPEPRIEVYFPSNTDSLIARFNDVLAKQSVKEATRLPEPGDSTQIWIVHDTQQLPDQEIQLMARLIQNFPGANIRAILLMTGSNPQKASLAALGRKVLRWDIEAPTPEQAQLALEQAAQNGQLQAVSQLLKRIGSMPTALTMADLEIPVTRQALPEPPQLPRWRAVAATWRSAILRLNQRRRAQFSVLGQWVQSAEKKTWHLAAVAVSALLLSVGIMVWIQPHAFGSAKPLPAASPTVSTAPVPSPVATTSAASEPEAEVPDESQQSQAWVRGLPPGSFLVQHGSVSTYEKALEIKKLVPKQGKARIVAAYRPGEELAHFVIVSGPFDSLGLAYDSMKRREATKTSWVRATRTLQQQINESKRAKEVRP